MSDQPLDQTSFIDSIGLRDDDESGAPIKTSTHPSEKKESPLPPIKKKPRLLYALIAIGLLFFMVLFIAVAMMPHAHPISSLPTPTPAAMIGAPVPSDLQKSIDELNTDITNADPQNNDLPFPPVNFQLHLVPPTPSP